MCKFTTSNHSSQKRLNYVELVEDSISQNDFNNLIKNFQELFSPMVKKLTGKDLKIINGWSVFKFDEGGFNPNMDYNSNKSPEIFMPGGFAKRTSSSITLELVMCHELGHIIGGAPLDIIENEYGEFKISSEGQADYWSGSCLRKLWANRDLSSIISSFPDKEFLSFHQDQCSKVYVDNDQGTNICIVTALAGFDFIDIARKVTEQFISYEKSISHNLVEEERYTEEEFDSLRKDLMVDFFNRDSNVVESSIVGAGTYPSTQCRFDSIISGALCKKHLNNGNCEQTDLQTALRPQCWFSR